MDKDVNRILNYLTERLEIAINHSKDDEQRVYIRAKGMVTDARELGFKPDMREKVKEYISELEAEIDRLDKILEDMITEPEKETVDQRQKDKINFEIIKSRAHTLMDVKCDLESRLEELV